MRRSGERGDGDVDVSPEVVPGWPLGLTVSPLKVTGWFWSGRVWVTPLPGVDLPVSVLVTPDLVWLALAESVPEAPPRLLMPAVSFIPPDEMPVSDRVAPLSFMLPDVIPVSERMVPVSAGTAPVSAPVFDLLSWRFGPPHPSSSKCRQGR